MVWIHQKKNRGTFKSDPVLIDFLVFFYKRLLDWEERPEIVREKHEKVVVIKNLFAPEHLNGNVALISKLKEDLKFELETYGTIRKILIHVKEK